MDFERIENWIKVCVGLATFVASYSFREVARFFIIHTEDKKYSLTKFLNDIDLLEQARYYKNVDIESIAHPINWIQDGLVWSSESEADRTEMGGRMDEWTTDDEGSEDGGRENEGRETEGIEDEGREDEGSEDDGSEEMDAKMKGIKMVGAR